MNKKSIFVFLMAMIAIGQGFAQTAQWYDSIDVEQLRLKADSVAQKYLKIVPDFYGYSAVLHTDNDGRLTTLTYPLDAKFRYALPEEIGVKGVGIAVTLDARLSPDVQVARFTAGKKPIKGEYMGFEQAIAHFTLYCPDHDDMVSVSLMHEKTIDEPTYLFEIKNRLFVLNAITGDYIFLDP